MNIPGFADAGGEYRDPPVKEESPSKQQDTSCYPKR
jgi:hypothetical protein